MSSATLRPATLAKTRLSAESSISTPAASRISRTISSVGSPSEPNQDIMYAATYFMVTRQS